MLSWETFGQSVKANGENLALFSISLKHATQITLQSSPGKRQRAKSLWLLGGSRRTFTRGGATVVFEVRAVFALVVLRASTVVVCGQVEAGRSILTWVRRAVIDIQLRQKGIELRAVNLIADILSATLNRAQPTASSLKAVPGNNTRTALGGRGKNKAET